MHEKTVVNNHVFEIFLFKYAMPVLVIAGLLGNFVHILGLRRIQRRSHYYIYTYFIAFFDVLACINFIVWPIIYFNANLHNEEVFDKVILPYVSLKIQWPIEEVCAFSVNWMIVCVAIDRCLAIGKPVIYRNLYVKKYFYYLSAGIVVINSLLSIPYGLIYVFLPKCELNLTSSYVLNVYNNNTTLCKIMYFRKENFFIWNSIFDRFIVILNYSLPIFFSVLGNVYVGSALFKKRFKARNLVIPKLNAEINLSSHQTIFNLKWANNKQSRLMLVLCQCLFMTVCNFPYVVLIQITGHAWVTNLSYRLEVFQYMAHFLKQCHPMLSVYIILLFDEKIAYIWLGWIKKSKIKSCQDGRTNLAPINHVSTLKKNIVKYL
ncbi:unnamed protein product [Gordionus sp. m RMFG-2023]